MRKLYYMHPINTYGTDLESEQLKFLCEQFQDWEIVNPNLPEHQEGHERLKAKTGDGMLYFVELASQCQGGVAVSFRDGKFGAGIFREMAQLIGDGHPVWIFSSSHPHALCKLDVLDLSLRLSVEETRKRIRNEDGSRRKY